MIKSTSIEIMNFAGGKERRKQWIAIADVVRRARNALWSYWLVYHTLHGTEAKLRQWLADNDRWLSDKKNNTKPKWPVDAFPKETQWQYSKSKQAKNGKVSEPDLENDLYHVLRAVCPELGSRTATLLRQAWARDVRKRKAVNGSLSGWAAILLGRQSVPSFNRAQPIPISQSEINKCPMLRKEDGDYLLRVAIDRTDDGLLHEDCTLMLRRRKSGSIRAIIDRIISGEYALKGSSLVYSQAKNKWFAKIAYEMPPASKPELVDGRTLYLIPGKQCPWVVLAVSETGTCDSWRAFGRRHHVENFRRLLLQKRSKRQEASKWGSENRKGHGRQRATLSWTKYSDAWMKFVDGYQTRVVAKLMELCRQRGYSKLVYCRPNDAQAAKTYLVNAGNVRNSNMGWQWYQLQSMLANKCQEVGIEFQVKTTDDVQGVRDGRAAKPKRRGGTKAADLSRV